MYHDGISTPTKSDSKIERIQRARAKTSISSNSIPTLITIEKISKFLPIILLFTLPLIPFLSTKQIQNNETTHDNRIEELVTKVSELEKSINFLNQKYNQLRQEVTTNSGPFNNPDYDSGWIPIEPGVEYTFTHGCGVHVFVYLIGWDYSGEKGYLIHQDYHSDNQEVETSSWGIKWCCSDIDQITIHRDINDKKWDEIRFFIWNMGNIG